MFPLLFVVLWHCVVWWCSRNGDNDNNDDESRAIIADAHVKYGKKNGGRYVH